MNTDSTLFGQQPATASTAQATDIPFPSDLIAVARSVQDAARAMGIAADDTTDHAGEIVRELINSHCAAAGIDAMAFYNWIYT